MLVEHCLDAREILAQPIRLAQCLFVVVGDRGEERRDFHLVEAAERAAESLLSQIERADLHASVLIIQCAWGPAPTRSRCGARRLASSRGPLALFNARGTPARASAPRRSPSLAAGADSLSSRGPLALFNARGTPARASAPRRSPSLAAGADSLS